MLYVLIAGVFLFKNPLHTEIAEKLAFKHYFKATVVIVFIAILTITIMTDGNALKVDRWSAMDVAVQALSHGDYPYTATDHLNGRTSNFPGLLLIGLPFYLLGNVGYLQAASFLLLAFTLYKTLPIKIAFHYLVLLLMAPAYWWEIFSISDLFSNMILVFCFVVLLKQKWKQDIFKHPVFLGISTSFLVLTRGITAIPLILLVFKDFCKISFQKQWQYASAFVLTFALLILMVLINCPDFETLKSYNPLVLQTSYLPNYILGMALLLPFYFSFKIKSFENDFFFWTSLLLSFPTLLAFFIRLSTMGIERILIGSYFDLSYLSIIIPFMLYEIVNEQHVNTSHQSKEALT